MEPITLGQCYEKIYSGSSSSSKEDVASFLNSHVHETERNEIESELKKTYSFKRQKFNATSYQRRPPQRRQGTSKRLTARERRQMGLSRLLPQDKDLRYKDFTDLHKLWKDYMRDLLDLKNYEQQRSVNNVENSIQMRICRADYHGAKIKVTKSSCVTNIGLTGLVLMESRNAFQIITSKNELKLVPKFKTSFSFALDGYLFTFNGNNMRCKPSERAVKKWKNKTPYDF